MRYDRLRDVVAQRKPGWEHLQGVSILILSSVVLMLSFSKIFDSESAIGWSETLAITGYAL